MLLTRATRPLLYNATGRNHIDLCSFIGLLLIILLMKKTWALCDENSVISQRLWIFTSCSNTVFCCAYLMRICVWLLLACKLGPWNIQNVTALNSPKSRILALYSTVKLLKSLISVSGQGKEICMHIVWPGGIISLNFPNPKIKHCLLLITFEE